MLHPSYTDLMTTINERMTSDEEKLKSRYSIVIASSKRAREIIAGDDVLTEEIYTKPLSNAVNELFEGKIDIVSNN
ncbi:DNA-directed RNA polymerase subunit omega [Vallitalea pronyensis]|uniref:DNA-directed RNA polymerase subunit omega n=1 Tax=Vallitalea pronyensis TaxID=1348613 RepID=A0A8J8SGZ8_9FIRM|nr:DNA-directed RNA polymerase subunit omega [Vallitalea pronyensis]QUI22919.1 DNA-directed RNA polymerase subunit omega [Vallitalea pronyensis]